MQNEIQILIEDIKADYLAWTSSYGRKELTETNLRMIEEFNNGIEIHEGKKYIKIVSNRSVWGFVVKVENDKQFAKGAILKAAGWNAPARNHARGNVLEGGYTIQWTGPLYM